MVLFSFIVRNSDMKMPLLLACFLLNALLSHAQVPDKFYGNLVGLQPDGSYMYQRVLSVDTTAKARYRFAPAIEAKATVTIGKFSDGRTSEQVEALLVEPPGKMPYLAIDLNADAAIASNERFEFAQGQSGEYLYSTVRLPIKNPLFPSFPAYVRYYRGFKHPKLAATDRLIDQSVWAHAIGDVIINGKAVRFQYPFDPAKPTISTTEGLFAIDVDGDGKIHNEQFSLETSYASDEEVVLRYGDIYLSTSMIDLAKNEIVVRRREKTEYLREELTIGKQMPDFSFTDFAGKPRSLKEFRGKYLLIEWWGVWCVDCVRDMPFTLNAYERFRPRGLEILGLNWDDKVEDAVGFLQKSKADWPQARKDSIKTLTEVTYRIQSYPSAILLDPDGKVLFLEQKALEGSALLQTLDRLLPR